MRIPIRKIPKRTVEWLAENFCRHGHSYLEHYSCFVAEKPDTSPMQEKIGIFDIETTGLEANWSHMIAWCMKEHNEDVVHSDLITSREARDKNDQRIIKSAVKEIKKYDRIVGYYSKRFDIPYVRSRALYYGMDFPCYKDLYHTDLWFVARSKLRFRSNRLQAICEFYGIEAKNHPMTPELWRRAGKGEKEALDTILIHCDEDVRSTDTVFNLMLDHMLMSKTSI